MCVTPRIHRHWNMGIGADILGRQYVGVHTNVAHHAETLLNGHDNIDSLLVCLVFSSKTHGLILRNLIHHFKKKF